MASEVLKTSPKNAPKLSLPSLSLPKIAAVSVPSQENFAIPSVQRVPPSDIEVKTMISIGINTQDATNQCVRVLEEMKPILKTANTKFSTNSLLASVIENIQNQKTTNEGTNSL